MLSRLTSDDVRTVMGVVNRFAIVDATALTPVLDALRCHQVPRGERFLHAGQPAVPEVFVLQGLVRTHASDAQGREVTLGFYAAPCVLAPAITRSIGPVSRVDATAVEGSRVALFDPDVLSQAMVENLVMREWGNVVLRHELVRKADREWSLAVLSGAERLAQLRCDHPGLEDRVPHHLIASYLGITPVTLSRLRSAGPRPSPTEG